MNPAIQTIRGQLSRMIPAPVRRRIKSALFGLPPICPQLRAWAETTKQAEIVKIFWEEHRQTRALPSLLEDPMPPLFVENQTYPVYDRALYRIPRVKIRGRAGILTLPDGSVCYQTAWMHEQITGSPDYSTRWRGPVVDKPGNYCTLIFYWGLFYYHWYNDALSSLFENLELLPADTKFILPADVGAHHLATLDMLRIGPERRVVFDGSEVWTLENLWFQPPAVHPDDQTPGAMPWLGRTLGAAVPPAAKEKPVRLYISRRLAQTRSVANEEELQPLLDQHGFKTVLTENLSPAEQVKLFRHAEAIVAPHGGGLTNMIFSPPGTPVLELFSSDNIRRCYWTLSQEMDHRYHFLLGEPAGALRRDELDIRMSPPKFARALETLLAEAPHRSQLAKS